MTRLGDRQTAMLSLLQPFVDQGFPVSSVAVVESSSDGRDASVGSEAVAVLGSRDDRELRRDLFDRGLIAIGSTRVGAVTAQCFLASDLVRCPDRLDTGSHGQIIMSDLGRNGRFGNQLFQYAFLKLYALRHGMAVATPDWQGRAVYGLTDPVDAGITLPSVAFAVLDDSDRRLWEMDDPPVDVDFSGYFQELPECWRRHRPLLRKLFRLPREQQNSMDEWRRDLAGPDQRTLVAVHVRRGDYRRAVMPAFRTIPIDWYLSWLRSVWPTLNDPLLFVATDEPAAVRPHFAEFEMVSTIDHRVEDLADQVRDFEMMRRADLLAIANSSLSRMAAILAPATQSCFIPSQPDHGFVPYQPWIDAGFWTRFSPPRDPDGDRAPRPRLPTTRSLLLDVTDLLQYVSDHNTLSGIQRVQCEIVRHLLDQARPDPVHLVVVGHDGLATVDSATVIDIVDRFRSEHSSGANLGREARSLYESALPCPTRPGDVFLTTGAFWAVSSMGRIVHRLKNSSVTIGVFIHDMLPLTNPEYFEQHANKLSGKALTELMGVADFVLTPSEFTQKAVVEYRSTTRSSPASVDAVPLALELSTAESAESEIGEAVAGLVGTEFVLCVGTIEIRKNPAYLFNIWKLMVQSGRTNIPKLVFAGRRGWLVHDFIQQLEACNHLDSRIVLLHDVTDPELDLLYRECLLTMFPSFDEGWGLPVGESLAYGKICIASDAGGIPEVAGPLADYVDPYSARTGIETLTRYLDDPDLLRRREAEITRDLGSRSWRDFAADIGRIVRNVLQQPPRFDGIAAITLPPGRFLPVSNDAAAISGDPRDGSLSAEVACISGWQQPEVDGVWADQPTAAIRFRAAAAVEGSKIVLILRLTASGPGPCRLRIQSGSGATTFVTVGDGADQVSALSCEVERGSLVTAWISRVNEDPHLDPPHWKLRDLLYHLPNGAGSEPVETIRSNGHPPAEPIEVANAPGLDESGEVPSLSAFRQSDDAYWPAASGLSANRAAPLLADRVDNDLFHSRYRNSATARVGDVAEALTITRRANQYVSMSRFTEGAVFDRTGVSRGLGFIEGTPTDPPWSRRDADRLWVDASSAGAAPYHDATCLVFYNGNLHNYFHWMAEGILPLEILTRELGSDPDLRIALPKSMDDTAVFDHRGSLRALGFDELPTFEVAEDLIQVRGAIWIEIDDFLEHVPAPYLESFRQRIATRYASARGPRTRRLLIERKGWARTISNLGALQRFLAERGFETVSLDGMSIEDQILMFQSAEFVVGAHGAGLTNLLFCERGTMVIELMPAAEMRPFFWLISEKLGLVHAMQFCGTVSDDFQASLEVDLEKFETLYRMVEARHQTGC